MKSNRSNHSSIHSSDNTPIHSPIGEENVSPLESILSYDSEQNASIMSERIISPLDENRFGSPESFSSDNSANKNNLINNEQLDESIHEEQEEYVNNLRSPESFEEKLEIPTIEIHEEIHDNESQNEIHDDEDDNETNKINENSQQKCEIFSMEDLKSIIHVLFELPIQRQHYGLKHDPTMFLHLETNYDKFHKNPLINTIFISIQKIFSDEIEMFCHDYNFSDDNSFRIFVESILVSNKWKNFVEKNLSELKLISKDLSLNTLKEGFLIDKNISSLQSPVSTVESGEWEYFSPFNPYEEDYIEGKVTTNAELKTWSSNLLPNNPIHVRKLAMESFMKTFVGDFITRDIWKLIIETFAVVLVDKDEYISSSALYCYQCLYPYAHPEALVHLHFGLIKNLKNIFERKSLIEIANELNDTQFENTVKLIQLLNNWQIELPNQWVNISEQLCEQLFSRYFELFHYLIYSTFLFTLQQTLDQSKSEFPLSHLIDINQISTFQCPLVYISLVDPEANWFKSWSLQKRRRHLLFEDKFQKSFINQLIQICNYISSTLEKDTLILNYIIENQYLYLLLIQSICILCEMQTISYPSIKILNEAFSSILSIYTSLRHLQRNSKRINNLISIIQKGIENILTYNIKTKFNNILEKEHLSILIHSLKDQNINQNNYFYYLSLFSLLDRLIDCNILRRHFFEVYHDLAILDKPNSEFWTLFSFCAFILRLPSSNENIKLKESIINLIGNTSKHVEFNRALYLNSNQSENNQLEILRLLKYHIEDKFINKTIVFNTITKIGSLSSGLNLISNFDLVFECYDFLIQNYFDQNYGNLIIQFFSLPIAFEFLNNLKIKQIFEDFQNNNLHLEWDPNWEKQITIIDKKRIQLIFLLASTPYFIPRINLESNNNDTNIVDKILDSIINNTSNIEEHKLNGIYLLNALASNLDSYLILQSFYNIDEFLKNFCLQNEDDEIIKDELSLLSNRILIRYGSLGGPNEKPRTKFPLNQYYPFNIYSGSYQHIKKLENDCNLKIEIKESNWNRNLNIYSLKEIKQDGKFELSQNISIEEFKIFIQLSKQNFSFEYLKKYLLDFTKSNNNYKLELIDNHKIESPIKYPKYFSQADSLIINYGKIFNKDIEIKSIEKLRDLISSHSIFSKQNTIKEYDWFSLIILLITEDVNQTLDFLLTLSKIPYYKFIWKRLSNLNSNNPNSSILIISELVELILMNEWEEDFNFLQLQGLSCLSFVTNFVSQFFLNYLDFSEITCIILLILWRGVDWIVYVCTSCIHHLCNISKQNCDFSQRIDDYQQWKYMFGDLDGFSFDLNFDKMIRFENKYRTICLSRMNI